MAELRYEVELTGLRAEDVRLVALHQGEPGKAGGILARLVEPGRLSGRGSIGLGFRARGICTPVGSTCRPIPASGRRER